MNRLNASNLFQSLTQDTPKAQSEVELLALGEAFQNRYFKDITRGIFIDLDKGLDSTVKQSEIRANFTLNVHQDVSNSTLETEHSMLFGRTERGLHAVNGIRYKPNEPLLFAEHMVQSDTQEVYLNAWTNPNITPTVPTDSQRKLLDEYFQFMVKDEVERLELLKWLAHVVRRPEQKTNVALLLFGSTNGTGKGTLGMMLQELVHKENCFFPENAREFLTGRFKDDLANTSMVFLDEIYQPDSNDPRRIANAVKQLVSEDILSLEVKGEKRIRVKNFTNWIATTNAGHPFSIEAGDRRWLVFEIREPDEDKRKRQQYRCGKLRDWINEEPENFKGVFRFYLDEVDISSYHPHKKDAYRTKARAVLVENSKTVHEEQSEDVFADFEKRLYFTAKDFTEHHKKVTDKPLSRGKLKEYLENLGCERVATEQGRLRIGADGKDVYNIWITPNGLAHGLQPTMSTTAFKETVKRVGEDTLINDVSLATGTPTDVHEGLNNDW